MFCQKHEARLVAKSDPCFGWKRTSRFCQKAIYVLGQNVVYVLAQNVIHVSAQNVINFLITKCPGPHPPAAATASVPGP
jgi:hypothetical protein